MWDERVHGHDSGHLQNRSFVLTGQAYDLGQKQTRCSPMELVAA